MDIEQDNMRAIRILLKNQSKRLSDILLFSVFIGIIVICVLTIINISINTSISQNIFQVRESFDVVLSDSYKQSVKLSDLAIDILKNVQNNSKRLEYELGSRFNDTLYILNELKNELNQTIHILLHLNNNTVLH